MASEQLPLLGRAHISLPPEWGMSCAVGLNLTVFPSRSDYLTFPQGLQQHIQVTNQPSQSKIHLFLGQERYRDCIKTKVHTGMYPSLKPLNWMCSAYKFISDCTSRTRKVPPPHPLEHFSCLGLWSVAPSLGGSFKKLCVFVCAFWIASVMGWLMQNSLVILDSSGNPSPMS